jgi:transcriptional regulator GlxA family with amidase domain
LDFAPLVNEYTEDRTNDVYAYTIKHFYNKIDAKEIASIACLNNYCFFRHFKQCTGKTPAEF